MVVSALTQYRPSLQFIDDVDNDVCDYVAELFVSMTWTLASYLLFPARHLQPLISILTPIYWTTAVEVGEAVNGYTLTQGNFRREVQVEFATGML